MTRIVSSLLFAIALTACAGVEPVDPAAEPGAEGASCALDACGAGLQCVAATCVLPCMDAAGCGGRACLPMPGSPIGWCALDPAAESGPAAPDSPLSPAPAPDEAVPDPEQPAPGELPPPKVPESAPPADTPPAEEPAPPTEEPAPPAEEPAPPAEEPPAPTPPAEEPPAPTPPPEEPPAAPPPCSYPGGFHAIQNGAVMPNLSWSGAYDGRGQRVDFSLEDFHCDPAYDRYSVLAVIVGAEWCGACSQFLAQNAGRMAGDDAAGALYLFVEVQDNGYNPASNEVAQRVVDRHAPGAPGIRVGDGATSQRGAFGNAPLVQQYPTIFAVRRHDMSVVASLGGYMDFAALARQEFERAPQGSPPDVGGGGAAPGPAPGPAPAGCEEEPQEPNDTPNQPPTLRPGDQIVGGVCNGTDDYFRVEHDGFWTLDLRFRHGDGDLDVYVWDPLRNGPAIGLDGQPVGSASATDDEVVIFLGPQVIQVTGYQGARAPYTLTLMGH